MIIIIRKKALILYDLSLQRVFAYFQRLAPVPLQANACPTALLQLATLRRTILTSLLERQRLRPRFIQQFRWRTTNTQLNVNPRWAEHFVSQQARQCGIT